MSWQTDPFYLKRQWKKLRAYILKKDRYECQECKKRGRYSRATIVHHVKHRDEYPELEMEEYYIDEQGVKQRNLISVCKNCHENVCHPERMRELKVVNVPERW